MIRVPSSVFRLACIVTLFVPLLGSMAYGESAGAIAEADILSLQDELASPGKSTVAVRMAMKNVARRGQALLKEAPEAPNRFVVLGIIFQSQKRLLGLEDREETVATDKTAGGRGGDRARLSGQAMNACARGGLAAIMARDRPDCPVIQHKRQNTMLDSWLESSERPMAVVGDKPSRKSRLQRFGYERKGTKR